MTDYLRHPDWLALLRGVCEEPDSDLRRLVAADWLDERGGRAGEIHAGFIRRQIAGEVRTVPLTVLVAAENVLGCQPHQCRNVGDPGATVVTGPNGTELTYRRGFVSAVTLTQLAFLGGGCPANGCRGGYLVGAWQDGRPCCACRGTGRTPGIAAALFAAHPIEVVTLADFAPMTLGEEAGEPYFAALDGALERPHMVERAGVTAVLAPALYGRVAARASWANRTYCSFVPSLASLLTAVSDACVAHGRDLVGLTALAAGVPARLGRG